MSMPNSRSLDDVVEALLDDGWVVAAHAVPSELLAPLAQRACELERSNELVSANVGRASSRIHDPEVRGDRICWIEPSTTHRGETALLAWLDRLRARINQRAFLGLFEFEGHYAIYAPGHGYVKHRDRFRDDDARVLSCVVYLNERWCDADGGQLRLHLGNGQAPIDVLPQAGTVVAFLSDRFEHEVLPAARQRASIAGWFRRRAA